MNMKADSIIIRPQIVACTTMFRDFLFISFALVCFCGSGCYREPDFPERFRSQHFVVFSNYEYDRSQGEQWLNDWLEKHFDVHTEYLGATAHQQKPIRI